MKRDIGIVMACYGQPNMMAVQQASWNNFPEAMKSRLQIIVIDDHGYPEFTCDEDTPYELRIYRVEEDIEWNQPGAKNLGFKETTASWIINMDPDMVFTPDAAEKLFAKLQQVIGTGPGHHYKFGLAHGSEEMDYSSPNAYVVHVDDYWKAGGYNEDFSGHKGYSDVILHRVLQETTKTHHLDVAATFRSNNKVISDATVQTLDRSTDHNRKLFEAAIKFAAKHGWRRYPLTYKPNGWVRFKWSRVR